MPCDCRVDCPGTDSPFANISSEAPDALVFIGYNFGWGNTVPPLGDLFSKTVCAVSCTSKVSQEDADLCAARGEITCVVNPTDPPPDGWTDPGGSSVPLYSSDAVSCSGFCPDGLPFTYFVAPGAFIALNQLTADRIAFSYACRLVTQNKVCLSAIPREACRNQPYAATITASSAKPVLFWTLSGDFPTGLNFTFTAGSSTATISGSPNVEGSHTFSVTVRDVAGNFMTKNYTICVIDIGPTNTTLPNAAPTVPYSQQMTATSCATGPLSWSISSGALPAGLSLDPITGIISGTPTTGGTFTFMVQVQTAAT